jgi:adenylate cyclase
LNTPDAPHHALLAACHAQLGDAALTATHVAEVLKRVPGFTIREHCVPVLHYRTESDLAHHCDSLRKAGLPE